MFAKLKSVCFAAMAALIVVSGVNLASPTPAFAKSVEVKKAQGGKHQARRTNRHAGNRHAVRVSARHRHHKHRRHVYWRSRSSNWGVFVLIGPTVAYDGYGGGWCRALHSGRHWAPRIGWHGGRHVGLVRCG